MKYLYKYPQRAFPYADLVETNRRPVARGVRVRAARHRRLRRGPLLRRVRRVRQGGAGGHADPDHRAQPRARGGAGCTCCRRCGSATPGRGATDARKPSLRQAAPARRSGGASRARRRTGCTATARRSCCSPRTRPTRSASGASRTRRRTSRTPSTTTSSTARRDAVNPAQTGTKAAAHYALDVAGRRQRDGPAAPVSGTGDRAMPFGDFDAGLRRAASPRADEFYAADHARRR